MGMLGRHKYMRLFQTSSDVHMPLLGGCQNVYFQAYFWVDWVDRHVTVLGLEVVLCPAGRRRGVVTATGRGVLVRHVI